MNQPIVTGSEYLIRGFKLLRNPQVLPFVIIPILINLIVYSAILWYSVEQFGGALAWLHSMLPEWLSFLDWILWPLFILTLLILMAYTFTIVANLIASPFNGLLSERVEQIHGGEALPEQSFGELLATVPRSIKREIAKLGHYLPKAIAVLIISFIPGINAIAPFLWLLLGAWMMCVEYCDFPMDNHGLDFKASVQRLKQQRFISLGFGGSTLALTMIPLLSLVVIPAAVCGGTLYWMEQLEDSTKAGNA